MTPTKTEFYQPSPSKPHVKVERAHVVSFNDQGRPLLRFEGESTTSSKVYPKMRHYSARIGDRVLIMDDIILGTWTDAE